MSDLFGPTRPKRPPGYWRFDSKQPRDPGGEGGGQWTKSPAVEIDEPVAKQIVGHWTGSGHGAVAAGYNSKTGAPESAEARAFHGYLAHRVDPSAGTRYRGTGQEVWIDDTYEWEGKTVTDRIRTNVPSEVADSFNQRKGEVLEWTRPTSTSTRIDKAEKFAAGGAAHLVYEIETTRARPVSRFAAHREAHESEDVVLPGRFEILGAEARDVEVSDPFYHGTSHKLAVIRLRDLTTPEDDEQAVSEEELAEALKEIRA